MIPTTPKEAYEDAIDYVQRLAVIWERHYQGERLKGMASAAKMIIAGLEEKATQIQALELAAELAPEEYAGEDKGQLWDEDSFEQMA